MNPVLSSIFNLRAHRAAHRRLAVLVDASTGVDPADVVAYLKPWSSWITVECTLLIETAIPTGLFQALKAGACHVVMLVSVSPAISRLVREECDRYGLAYAGSELPARDSLDLAYAQEVIHHDSEMGGFNEWSQKDALSSPWILRMLSATHCRRQFPHYVVSHLETLRQAANGRTLEAIDIGCGPISRLRWGQLAGYLRVTGVDPLLDMYAVLHERHGLNGIPSLRCAREVSAFAEALTEHLPAAGYDFAYSSNALDHTSDPAGIVRSLATVIRPGGLVALEVFTREGSRENWWQLHQFDIYVNDAGQVVSETRDHVVTPLFPAGGGFEVLDIPIRHDTVTAVVARRV